MIKRSITFILLLVSLLVLMPTISLADKAKVKNNGLSSVKALIVQAKKNKTRFSIHLRDLSDNRTIYSYHADDTLMPASNMKIITTAAALDILGADFNYHTIFAMYHNNLVIIADGDPLSGDPILAKAAGRDIFTLFARILNKLQQKNITVINGNLLIDDTIFDDVRYCPSWPKDQANRWYAAQISALNFNDNCIDINLKPAAILKQPVLYTTSPNTRYVNIVNKCYTVSKKTPNTAWASRKYNTNAITLRGNCNQAQTIYVTVNRPSAYFGYVLAEYLLRHNISIKGRLIIKSMRNKQGQLPDDMDILLDAQRPLKEVLTACNTRSLNLAAECLFKTIGAYYSVSISTNTRNSAPISTMSTALPHNFDAKAPPTDTILNTRLTSNAGSWVTGRKAVRNFLTRLNISPQLYNIDDGSGLSHNDRLSARCITAVLAYVYHSKDRTLFLDTLARPSAGTLSKHHRFAAPSYKGRIFAKTGYITGANSLSGFFRASSGKWFAFSVLTNSPPASNSTIDSIVKKLMATF